MRIYVDIDETICFYGEGKNCRQEDSKEWSYDEAEPSFKNIAKINKLYEDGHFIKYWTGRGTVSKKDYYYLTKQQLKLWGCKYHELSVGKKPDYDLLICDKTKRIEELPAGRQTTDWH